MPKMPWSRRRFLALPKGKVTPLDRQLADIRMITNRFIQAIVDSGVPKQKIQRVLHQSKIRGNLKEAVDHELTPDQVMAIRSAYNARKKKAIERYQIRKKGKAIQRALQKAFAKAPIRPAGDKPNRRR